MLSVRNPGRIAGLWYFVLILFGPLRLIYIPAKLFVSGDATPTVNNITAHERLFRLGIADDLVAALVLTLVTLAFHRLFVGTNRCLAALVVILGGIMPAVLYLFGAALDLGVMSVSRGLPFLTAFTASQQHSIAMLLLKLHDLQNTAAETLWGASLAGSLGVPWRTCLHRDELYGRFDTAVQRARFHPRSTVHLRGDRSNTWLLFRGSA